jgi:hypothetical protein
MTAPVAENNPAAAGSGKAARPMQKQAESKGFFIF